jgi:tetratricopeptide (TPR) repeat protein
VLALLGLTIWAWIRKPRRGFLGGWFFAILAPSSSVVPLISQTMAEHRMYLPLAAVIALIVTGIQAGLGRKSWLVFVALAVGAAVLTERRNEDYRDAVRLWSTTVAHSPNNPRALYNLGLSLLQAGRLSEAIAQFEAALKLSPTFADAHNNLGNAWAKLPGRLNDAIAEFKEVLRLQPDFAPGWHNLGTSWFYLGNLPAAAAAFREELRLSPNDPAARQALAAALQQARDH